LHNRPTTGWIGIRKETGLILWCDRDKVNAFSACEFADREKSGASKKSQKITKKVQNRNKTVTLGCHNCSYQSNRFLLTYLKGAQLWKG